MHPCARIGLCLLGMALGAVATRAQVIVWDGSTSNRFVTGTNWVGDVAPGAANTARVGSGGGHTTIMVNSTTVGAVEFLSGRTVTALSYDDGTAALTLNGNFTVQTGPNLLITPFLNVVLTNAEHVFDIGSGTSVLVSSVVSGQGHLSKVGAGTLILSNVNTLSYGGGGGFNNAIAVDGGTLEINGGSISQPFQDIIVGSVSGGNGTLLVSNGGDVSAKYGVAGNDSGTNATITVTGAGSTWTNAQGMAVGYLGTGFLNILAGGTVTTTGSGGDHSYLGLQFGTSGTAVVSGTGSSWSTPNDELIIGGVGSGDLTASSGGTVLADTGIIGQNSFGVGTVTVDGAGSSFSATNALTVGVAGTGTVTATNGGDIAATNTIIGSSAGSNGTVSLTGSGSGLSNASSLQVGASGTGTFSLAGGATAGDDFGLIGVSAGSSGTATVAGTGSSWFNGQFVNVGGSGTGVLTLSQGGTVTSLAGPVTLGVNLGGTGTLNIGADSASAAVAGGFVNAPAITTGGGTGTLQFNTTASVANRYYLTTDGTDTGTAVAVGGATQLVNTAGYTVLLGTNTYTGGTTIAGGYLLLGYYGTVGSIVGHVTFTGDIDPGGGELQFLRSDNTTFAGNITGPGRVSNFGAGTLTLSGTNDYSGETFISGGAIADSGAGKFSADSVFRIDVGSSLLVSYHETIAGLDDYTPNTSGTVNFGAATPVLTLDISGNKTFSGVITGAGGLTKTGAGSQTLAGANNYTGNTIIKNGALALDGGSVTYVFGGPSTLAVGNTAGDNAALLIWNGGDFINANSTTVGVAASSTGQVAIDGAGSSLVTWTNLKVGGMGTGTLTLSNGATAGNYTGYIGDASGSTGEVTVHGAGSSWNSGSHLLVGNFGSGSLDILAGGHVNAATGDSGALVHVGYAAGSTGTVTVSGAGSQLKSYQSLLVGQSGNGTLNVDTGGTVIVTTFADIGANAGSVGHLNLASGGTLTNTGSSLGWAAGSTGVATVDGAGSTWTTTEGLYVGSSGDGLLSITNGGDVINLGTSNASVVALNSGSTGAVAVDGAGSTWSIADELAVGAGGDGTLDITNGATVTSASAFIGDLASGDGSAYVSGAGSSWTTNITGVGVDGSGSLDLANGGSFSSTFGYVGYSAGSTGVVTVDAGTWVASDYLYVGVQGAGWLSVANGGSVTSPNMSVGNNAGGTGSLELTGSGSSLSVASTLYVGSEGEGYLEISNSALASSQTGSIGNNAGGAGWAEVHGGGTWANTGSLLVGNADAGYLDIYAGGTVTAANASVGVLGAVDGGLTVWDEGSSFATTGNLTIGASGMGVLYISDGGEVNTGGHAIIGNNTGSSGAATLYVDGSWSIAGNLYIGNAGDGWVNATLGSTIDVGGGTGSVILGHSGGEGYLTLGYDGVDAAGAIVNAASITTGSGTGWLQFDTHTTDDQPFYLTRTGGSGGPAVTIDGATVLEQIDGYNVLTGPSTYTGGTVVLGGTLVAGATGALGTGNVTLDGGQLVLASGVTLTNPLSFVGGGTLGGSGTFGIPITVGTGIHLAPGNSPGTLTFTSGLTLADGGFLDFEVQAATGAAGTGYDTVVVTGGALDLSSVSAGGFTLKLISLNLLGDPGNVADFDFTNSYSWTVFNTTGITGFSANKFALDLTGFTNDLSIGSFVLAQSGNNLTLNFTAVPEPSTWALLALGLAGGSLAHWRRLRRRA